MKVIFLQAQFCVRAFKQAYAFKSIGHEVILFVGEFQKNVASICKKNFPVFYVNTSNMQRLFKQHEPFDFVYYHDECFWPIQRYFKIGLNYPVFMDLHDSPSVRSGKGFKIELKMARKVNGVVVSTAKTRDWYLDHGFTWKQVFFLDSRVPKNLYSKPRPGNGKMVYAGELKAKNGVWGYQNHFDFFNSIPKMIDILPTYVIPALKKSNLKYFPPVSYGEVPQFLSNYSVGVFPMSRSKANDSFTQWVVPNKIYDYMAAGIPIFILNSHYVSKFVESKGIGKGFKTVLDLKRFFKNNSDEIQKMRNNVLKIRDLYAMDFAVSTLIKFFKTRM